MLFQPQRSVDVTFFLFNYYSIFQLHTKAFLYIYFLLLFPLISSVSDVLEEIYCTLATPTGEEEEHHLRNTRRPAIE